jgi:copper chaperone
MRTQSALLHVQGMTCTGCEERIGKVLSRLDGVREAGADHRTGEVRVAFDPAQVSAGALAERIEQAGYQVTSTEESTS